jgi:hypothetical protein
MRMRITFIVSTTLILLCVATGHSQPASHPANPAIQAIVDEISADSIYSYVERLQGFHTRHTYSTLENDSVGIGAAMNWVQQKIENDTETPRWNFEQFNYTHDFLGPDRVRSNLIVRTQGLNSEARYIIGGHLDSRTVSGSDVESFAPGADDSGSSCAAFLELIRVLGDEPIDHDIEIIFFTGEEQGLWGSEAYADALTDSGVWIDGMLCLDMIGRITGADGVVDSNSVRVYAQGGFNQGATASSSRNLQRYLKWVGESYVDNFELDLIPATDRPGRGSDHISFSNAGFPAVRFIEQGEDTDYQHDSTDIVSRITPSYTRNVARAAFGGLLTLLKAPLRPDPVEVEWLGEGRIRVTIPESVALPAGGSFFITSRLWSHVYYDSIANIGEEREYIYEGAEYNQEIAFAISRANADGHPSPFSDEVVFWVNDAVDTPG